MKKILLLLISIIIVSKVTEAQIIWSTYSQSYSTGLLDKPSNVGIIVTIPEINNAFWDQHPNKFLERELAIDTSFQRNRPKGFVSINTFDTTKAQFFLHGVDKTNAGDYEFRVTDRDNKMIAPWSVVKNFPAEDVTIVSGIKKMAWLGGYSAPLGNSIIVDVRKKGSTIILSTAVVAWVPIRPILSDIYSANELNVFLKRLARPWESTPSPEEVDTWHKNYPNGLLDKNTGLPKKLIADPADNNLIFYLSSKIYHKEQLEYELIKNGGIFISWKTNDFDNGFVWLTNLEPGEYLLKMRYTAQREHVTEYPFLIKTPWYQSGWFHLVCVLLLGFFGGGFYVFILNIRHRKKIQQELFKKTKLQLELKAIYAQLNPHFIFNALSSIQGLINKQDIKGANSYLSDFAGLLRESLNNSNKEQIALKQEVAALETYLKLEQLRFGFKYDISVADNINVYETEIPSLLLQPLVENAVKHGVSALQEKGMININFVRQQNDMVVSVTDNGIGFRPAANTDGFGLKLTRDRIKLLNDFTNGQAISFEIKANIPAGTVAELIFKNWFL
ncbi:MAG TPA: histidine kinase [Mucilaginibacter sp.]|jgi:two-component system LytT family sensor kinase|nr:histidine kinase [Mucilaginibacter sp.]